MNAAVCAAAATQSSVAGLLGEDAADAEGTVHPGLPWSGCSILAADAAALRAIRAKAASYADTFVADMPALARRRWSTRTTAPLGKTAAEDVAYCAVSIVGPRNRVGKLVGKLPFCHERRVHGVRSVNARTGRPVSGHGVDHGRQRRGESGEPGPGGPAGLRHVGVAPDLHHQCGDP